MVIRINKNTIINYNHLINYKLNLTAAVMTGHTGSSTKTASPGLTSISKLLKVIK